MCIFATMKGNEMDNTTLKRKKFNNSKYRFHLLEIGDTFKVKAAEAHSMKVSLYYFNKRHGAGIELYIDDLSDENEYTVTRVK